MTNFTSIPLYEKVKEDILQKINNQTYKANDKLPNETELASAYDVSRITISKALALLADEGWIVRKQGKGTFIATSEILNKMLFPKTDSKSSQSVSVHQEHQGIAVIMPRPSDCHSVGLFNGICDSLSFPDYFIEFAVYDDEGYENFLINHLHAKHYSAMIIFPADSELYNDEILSMHLNKFPFVLMDRHFPGINSNYVISNNLNGGRIATKHLLDLGHRNVAFCSSAPKTEQATSGRYDGYVSTLEENNVAYDLNWCVSGIHTKESQEHLKKLIKNREITAAFATNTLTAETLYNICAEIGFNVPNDFSIITYDNISVHKSQTDFYTYIDQHSYEMGKSSGDIIKKILNNPSGTISPMNIVIEPTIVVNHSTAKPSQFR